MEPTLKFEGLHKKFEAIWHNFRPFFPVCRTLYVRCASVNLHWKFSPTALHSLCAARPFPGNVWRPSQCHNWVKDSSLERYLCLLSNSAIIFQFVVNFPSQKSNIPRLVKMCQMRLPKGRVLLQSTFECLPQLQIDLMVAHWKSLCV